MRAPVDKQIGNKALKTGARAFSTSFDSSFSPSRSYIATLPDPLENDQIQIGAIKEISEVGISNFKLPLLFKSKGSDSKLLEATVYGAVSLEAARRGINMSRIMRSFYRYKDRVFSIDSLAQILKAYKKDVGSLDADLKINFSYPIVQKSLRSKLQGYQYYQCAYGAQLDKRDQLRRFIEFKFVYSSVCPCSTQLAEHAKQARGVFAIPHSQRSSADIKIELMVGAKLSIEDLHKIALRAIKTETQVMVRREDEQAFAELNGAYPKFVEDAARLLYAELDTDKRIKNFEVLCTHYESLHSHDAVARICKHQIR